MVDDLTLTAFVLKRRARHVDPPQLIHTLVRCDLVEFFVSKVAIQISSDQQDIGWSHSASQQVVQQVKMMLSLRYFPVESGMN